MQITNEDILNIDRELCRRSLSEFVKASWHVLEPETPYVHGWHIGAVCDHLTAVTNGDITRLLVNIPPGTMKSLLVNVFWPSWEWGPLGMPATRIIGASHEQGLAVRDNLKMKRLITSEWYQERWPITLTSDQSEKLNFENVNTGWRQACAVRSMTGKRGDRVLWDDPLSVEGSMSPADRDTALRIFKETLPTRLNSPERSAIVVVMQRLHVDDPAGFILSNELGYEKLILPMEYETNRKCVTSIGFEDPRKEDGELLFPERFPRSVVDRDKRVMGTYATAGQFQQRPSPLGGGLIKTDWFNFYTVLPRLKFHIILADTAQKTKEANDYTVFEHWGLGKNGNVYLIDLIRGKWEADELKTRAVAFWQKAKALSNGSCRYMGVEDKSSGTGLIQQLRKQASPKIPVKAIPRTTDKLTRLMDVQGYIQSGYVHLPEGTPWLSDFLAECEGIGPEFKNHDDQIDPMIDAINQLLQKSSSSIADMV